MTAISNLPKDLSGKQITVCQAEIEIDIKLGLWQNYTEWLDPAQQLERWYDTSVLNAANVAVEIVVDNNVIAHERFDKFKKLHIHSKFNDDNAGPCNLAVNIINLSNVPIRDDTGIFVSGMLEIQSVKLQGLEIKHLLENTMFGNDCSVTLNMQKPIYKWMVDHYTQILPRDLNFPIVGI